MGPKTFQNIVDYMFPIREKYRHKPGTFYMRYGVFGLPFDYPDYAGLHKKVVNQLSPEAVDAMQYVLQESFVRKRDFSRAYKKTLIDLGEKLR